jgi:hypothetical protein
MSVSETRDCGASYSNITISGDRSHLGNNDAEKILYNY